MPTLTTWGHSLEHRKEPQDDAAMVKAEKISVEEARCCFKRSTAVTIHNK